MQLACTGLLAQVLQLYSIPGLSNKIKHEQKYQHDTASTLSASFIVSKNSVSKHRAKIVTINFWDYEMLCSLWLPYIAVPVVDERCEPLNASQNCCGGGLLRHRSHQRWVAYACASNF